MEFLFTFVS